MFIRSQNKEILIDANTIYLDSSIKNSYRINALSNAAPYFMIGEYSTEEKALKVMDMIQNAITGKRFEFIDIVRDCDLAGVEIHNVFNMPKDEELKEVEEWLNKTYKNCKKED